MLDLHIIHARARAEINEIDLLNSKDLLSIYGVDTLSPEDMFEGNAIELPVVLDLKGPDFSTVWSARVNDAEAAFKILSPGRMLVTIPKEFENNPLTSVDVFSSVLASPFTASSLFEFGFTTTPKLVTGRAKLLGQFIKFLLTTAGSDIFEPTMGGSLQKWPGRNFNSEVPEGLIAMTTLQILDAGRKFSDQQATLPLPADEKLLMADVMSVESSPADKTLVDVKLKLITFSGQNIFAELLVSTNKG